MLDIQAFDVIIPIIDLLSWSLHVSHLPKSWFGRNGNSRISLNCLQRVAFIGINLPAARRPLLLFLERIRISKALLMHMGAEIETSCKPHASLSCCPVAMRWVSYDGSWGFKYLSLPDETEINPTLHTMVWIHYAHCSWHLALMFVILSMHCKASITNKIQIINATQEFRFVFYYKLWRTSCQW